MSAFTLDENQAMLAESARKYVERGYGDAVRNASVAHPHGCSPARWREFAEFGWLALPLPESHGGLGGSVADICVLAEELGRALVIEPWLPCGMLAAGLMADVADETTAQQWLPALVAGEKRVACAVWEPGGRFDATRIATRAEPVDGGFRLFGSKELVLGAPGSDALLVSARVDGEVGLFLVDTAAAGLKIREYGLYDGARAARVDFDGAPAQALSAQADIPAMIEHAMDRAMVAHSAQTVGAMSRAFEITIEYLKVRKQFGRILAGNQVLQHRLVDLFVAIEEARALVGAAAQSFNGDAIERRNLVAAAKAFVSLAARTAWEEAVQMHGAIGMTEEYVIGRYVRHLAAAHTLFGDAEQHLERMARLEEVRHAGVRE